ncbi:MAG: hypothetical protein KDE26_23555, partial [Bacteroidetes bacterium]|nr:hypothetical protein [Bacteroidota bacterium]
GNLIYDRNKNITITYNHLNKPTLIKFGTTDSIEYFYDATGTKLRQRVSSGGASKTDYVGGFHYEHDVLQFFAHEEGRVVNDGTGILMYQYNLTDHLGNVRLTYEDTDSSGTITTATEVVQANDPYPFGMNMAGLTYPVGVPKNSYLYNGKELQDELGINLYDYGARFYDPFIARWNGVDALAEERNWLSPFNYTQNNPILRIDPDGNLDDEYKVNKDGYISFVQKTDDHYDILYATDIDGNVDLTNSVKIEKGVLDKDKDNNNIKKDVATDGTEYEYLKINNDNTATTLFEFVAKNTNVEWTQVKYGTRSNFLSTSHLPGSESGGAHRVRVLGEGRYTVREHIHSHPGDTGPSGFMPGDRAKDKGFAEWVNTYKKYFRQLELKVYRAKSGIYIKYNHEGVINN